METFWSVRRLRIAAQTVFLACLASSGAVGCGTYHYEYVLRVRCEGRKLANDPAPGSYVGLKPPVKVLITCDGNTKVVDFDPMGETQTLRFSEGIRDMIDGNASPRGFSVRIQRPTYKDWSADYTWLKVNQYLMLTEGGGEGGSFIRLDSVVLEPVEGPQQSRRVSGGPCNESKDHIEQP